MLPAIIKAIIKRITANVIDANTIPAQTPKAIFHIDNLFSVLGSSGSCPSFLSFIASIIDFIITPIINITAIAISK